MSPISADPLEDGVHQLYGRAVAATLKPNDTQKYANGVQAASHADGPRVTLIVAGCYVAVIAICA